ncbi:MAG: TM0106 family RecB-like putative nuclease [Verrucomicrobiota bacterium]
MAGEKAEEDLPASVGRPHSPSALVAFTACVHRTDLERAAAAGLVRKPHYPNAALEGLVERGRAHEKAHLEDLRAQGLDVVEIPEVDFRDAQAVNEAVRLTTDAMTRGRDVIYQATFLQTEGGVSWRARTDFLRRVEPPHPSRLGDWSYEPWDTKLARAAKASALLQLCVYAELVAHIQGTTPEHVHLILGGPGRPSDSYRLKSIAPYYRQVRKEFIARYAAGQPAPAFPVTDPYPDPVEHCDVCDWSSVCEKRWRDDDHVSLVAGITRNQRKALRARGVTTLTDLSTQSLPFAPPLERASPASVARVREQARVQREGREQDKPVSELILREAKSNDAKNNGAKNNGSKDDDSLPYERGMGLAALPLPSPGDLFFDIEGDPFVGDNGHEYLFGLATSDGQGRDATYEALWSFDAPGEKQMFEAVVDRIHQQLRAHPDMHVYHFAPYETSALKRLANRLGTRVNEVDDLLRQEIFVDLYRVVRQGIRASVESYSIKKLEPFYNFKRAMDLRLAGDARATLELWLEADRAERLGNHDELCRQIEDYNREDCVSARHLRDWLEERRRDLEAKVGAAIPRPTPEVREVKADKTDLQARIVAAKARLTADVPAEAAERSPAQQGQWLLAQLLEWHSREDKSAWWEFYRMCDLSDADMVEDTKALGGITYEGPAGVVRKSTIHRYRFVAQEHDVETGDDCEARKPGYRKADADGDAAGAGKEKKEKTRKVTLHEVDDIAGTFDVTVGNGRPPPEIGALIPKRIIPSDDHRDRLLEIADWTGRYGIDGDGIHHLARDLVMRVPPVGSGPRVGTPEDGGPALVHEGEPAQEAAIRVVLALARSERGGSLAIQGPPGSGKTHTGALMLLALVEAGLKVGVTGPSHKVIENLLSKACDLAREGGRTLAIGQKVGKDQDALGDAFVTKIVKGALVSSALKDRTIQIAAGTTWLWADADMTRSVDVLLVDEAGQMSLANAVAIAGATHSLAFLGDPRQLDQPRKGVHPEGAQVSVLEHLSPGSYTIAPHRGVFLDRTRRLHPDLCRFTSDTFYEGRLSSIVAPDTHLLIAAPPFGGAGIRWWPVPHEGNQNESPEEVAAVRDLFTRLLGGKAQWTAGGGSERDLRIDDIVVVAPYNAQVRALKEALPAGAKVGTVDKFQGQEAAVSIYSMTSSTPEDAPRGMDFLYNLNRLNVATSRAKTLAIVVGSPALLRPACKTPKQMMQASGVCALVEGGGTP